MTPLRKNPGESRNRTPGVWFSRQMSWPAGQGGGGCVVLQADVLTGKPRGWWVCGSPGRRLDRQAKGVVGVWFSRLDQQVKVVGVWFSRLDQQAKVAMVLHKYTPLCWCWPLQCGGATQIHTTVLVLTTPMWWCYTNTHHCVGADHSNVVVLHKYTPLCWCWPLQCGGATQIHTIVLVLTTPMWWCYTNTHHCVGADHSNVVVLHKYTPLCWCWPLQCYLSAATTVTCLKCWLQQ